MKPTRNPDIITRETGLETLLQVPGREQIYLLNITAGFIWKLCDGQHTMSEIEQAVRSYFLINPGQDVMADIQQTLISFKQAGLLL
jgi:hypothetical protein